MEWMLMPLKRYADFSGRSRRKEYWMFILFQILLLIIPAGLLISGMPGGDMTGEMSTTGMIGAGLIGLILLALLVPSIAVSVRRFHDQDKSGWFYLLNFIPYIGGLIVFIFMLLEGTRGPNRFGADPKESVTDVFG